MLHQIINPATGFPIASLSVFFIRGGKNPFVDELTSNAAELTEGDAVPIATAVEKDLIPPMAWVPAVRIPPFVASAGAKLNTPDAILAPLVVELEAIEPIVVELGVVQLKVPLAVAVNTWPSVPALVNPVPPLFTATAVPLQTPLVMAPTVSKLDSEVNVVLLVAVMFPDVVAVVALPLMDPLMVLLNVFAPANVCAALVTIPPFVPSAGAKLNTPELMLAPLAVEDPLIGSTLATDPVAPVNP